MKRAALIFAALAVAFAALAAILTAPAAPVRTATENFVTNRTAALAAEITAATNATASLGVALRGELAAATNSLAESMWPAIDEAYISSSEANTAIYGLVNMTLPKYAAATNALGERVATNAAAISSLADEKRDYDDLTIGAVPYNPESGEVCGYFTIECPGISGDMSWNAETGRFEGLAGTGAPIIPTEDYGVFRWNELTITITDAQPWQNKTYYGETYRFRGIGGIITTKEAERYATKTTLTNAVHAMSVTIMSETAAAAQAATNYTDSATSALAEACLPLELPEGQTIIRLPYTDGAYHSLWIKDAYLSSTEGVEFRSGYEDDSFIVNMRYADLEIPFSSLYNTEATMRSLANILEDLAQSSTNYTDSATNALAASIDFTSSNATLVATIQEQAPAPDLSAYYTAIETDAAIASATNAIDQAYIREKLGVYLYIGADGGVYVHTGE